MKKLITIIATTIILITTGCQSPNLHKRTKEVQVVGKTYYYLPIRSHSVKITTHKDARIFNKTTKGVLNCRKNDVLSFSDVSTLKELQSDYSQNKDIKYAKEGKTACFRPMKWREVKQYKANVAAQQRRAEEQRRINNDPRVVAARIQANAMAAQASSISSAVNAASYRQPVSYPTYNYTPPTTYNINVNTYKGSRGGYFGSFQDNI